MLRGSVMSKENVEKPKVLRLDVDTPESLEQAIVKIKSNPEVSILAFENFFIDMQVVDVITAIMSDTLANSKIHTICFNSTKIAPKVASELKTKLIEVLSNNKVVTTLDFDSNYLGDNGAEVLIKMLPSTNITSLSLDNNEISNGNFIYFLKDNKNMSSLNLGNNSLRDSGVEQIAKMLPYTHLTELYLNGNMINATGVKYLADSLYGNKILSTLSLSWNNIYRQESGKYDGIEEIANILLYTNLKCLHIEGNKLDNKCMEILADGLRYKPLSLQKLRLGWNDKINDKGIDQLLQIVTYQNITEIDLNGNRNISSKVLEITAEILEYNILRQQPIKGNISDDETYERVDSYFANDSSVTSSLLLGGSESYDNDYTSGDMSFSGG